MSCVKRAIIMAAGRGERLRPVTDTVPKPLVPVFGRPMIVSILEALRAQGIRETAIVTGYRGEAFSALRKDYPDLTLIENPHWEGTNNISSLYAARDWLPDSMILDGDQIIRNPEALSPDFERSGYNAIWTDEPTREWVLTLEGEVVTGCSRTGGPRGWQLFSVSRWSEDDGEQLAEDVTRAWESGRRDVYWDDVPLFLFPEHYALGIHRMNREDVLEIDSLEELRAVDPAWRAASAEMNGMKGVHEP